VKTRLPALLLGAALCGVSGCAHFGPKKPEVPEATLPTWLGRVVMVDTLHRFVLVDAGSASAPAIPKFVSAGPMPRMRSVFGEFPVTTKPPINTPSSGVTRPRLEILTRR
jgi:hypothetical protein